MRNWSRVWRLSAAQRSALAQALVLLPLTALALRVVGFRRWQAMLARLAPVSVSPAAGGGEAAVRTQARAVAQMVEAAARRGLYHATCLPRSLTLWWLLRRQGIDGELRLGVRKAGDVLEAHAWVEYRGAVLNDRADVRRVFSPFDRAVEPREGWAA
jgi:hypothetical protein